MSSGHRALSAMLYASRRLFGNAELTFSVTHASLQQLGGTADRRVSFQVALRTQLSALELPGSGRRPITGRVWRDAGPGAEEGTDPGAAPTPLAGIDVVLDGQRRTRTDSDGRFAFDAPGSGPHRVQAVLPPAPGAYFTAPSTQTLNAGGEARFGIAFAAARLTGRVLSDAQLPLAGVTVRLETASHAPLTAPTDSSGSYRFAAPAGDGKVAVVADSVPPGHDLAGLAEWPVQLAAGKPVTADFVVNAQRSIEGRVAGPGTGPATVIVQETGRRVMADGQTGRFVLRGLPPGRLSLVVERGGRRSGATIVEVPPLTGKVSGLVLEAP